MQLRAVRKAAGTLQAHLASHTDYDRSTISHIEAGHQDAPSAFWIAADDLLGANGVLLTAYNDYVLIADECRRQQEHDRHERLRAQVLANSTLSGNDSISSWADTPGEALLNVIELWSESRGLSPSVPTSEKPTLRWLLAAPTAICHARRDGDESVRST
ncbi:MAG: helix-turn-helix domain-containing protein [Pseudonocardia sp.]